MFNDRRIRVQLGILERVLDICSDYLEFVWIGEDLGTQHAPIISPDLYRRIIRPRHQQFVDLATAYKLPVMIHSCGSSSWAFDDFLEIGIRGVDTLQPEAQNMSPQYLSKQYGGKLVFHGCISTAGKLSNNTAYEVEAEVKDTLQIMMENRGYCLAPTHLIQDNTPVENIITMYQTAHTYGRY